MTGKPSSTTKAKRLPSTRDKRAQAQRLVAQLEYSWSQRDFRSKWQLARRLLALNSAGMIGRRIADLRCKIGPSTRVKLAPMAAAKLMSQTGTSMCNNIPPQLCHGKTDAKQTALGVDKCAFWHKNMFDGLRNTSGSQKGQRQRFGGCFYSPTTKRCLGELVLDFMSL